MKFTLQNNSILRQIDDIPLFTPKFSPITAYNQQFWCWSSCVTRGNRRVITAFDFLSPVFAFCDVIDHVRLTKRSWLKAHFTGRGEMADETENRIQAWGTWRDWVKAYCRMWENDGRNWARRTAGRRKMADETGKGVLQDKGRWLTRLGEGVL